MEARKKIKNWLDINMQKLDLEKLVVHFAQSNKAEGKSPKTVSWYSEMLREFIRCLDNTGKKTALSEFTVRNVRAYIAYEQQRGMSPHTVQAKVRALKACSSWLLREGYISSNTLTSIKLPKAPTKIITTLSS